MTTLRLAILLVCASVFNNALAQTYTIPGDVKRIVFLGNSITYQGNYVEYIDAYFSIRYPDRDLNIINVGLPSETVSGLSEPDHANGRFSRPDLHERLERVISATAPDLVLACYGMNDGIYLPFSEARFDKFKQGIEWMHEEIIKSGTKIVHVTPPIYDDRKGAAYANVLDIYANWLVSKRYTEGWNVADIHWPMKKMLEDSRLSDSTFAFAHDGIHPNGQGHFEIAKYILEYLEEDALSTIANKEEFDLIHPNGTDIVKLVQIRQRITKDAWLSEIGHKRPGMNQGLPIAEALKKSETIAHQIHKLVVEE